MDLLFGMLKILENNELTSVDGISEFILESYGIKTEVTRYEDKPMIKVVNHFSLFTLITKIRYEFDFVVYHQKGTNEYLLHINI